MGSRCVLLRQFSFKLKLMTDLSCSAHDYLVPSTSNAPRSAMIAKVMREYRTGVLFHPSKDGNLFPDEYLTACHQVMMSVPIYRRRSELHSAHRSEGNHDGGTCSP